MGSIFKEENDNRIKYTGRLIRVLYLSGNRCKEKKDKIFLLMM